GELGVVLDAVRAVGDIDAHRVRDWLADIARLEERQVLDVRADGLRKAPQDALALPRFEPPPGSALEARARRGDRRIAVSRAATCHGAYCAAIDRAHVLKHAPIRSLHRAAADDGPALGLKGRRQALPGAPVAPDGRGAHRVEASTVAVGLAA